MTSEEVLEPRNKLPGCPCCGGPASFLVASADYNRNTTDREFRYFRCAACGLVFMDRIPEDLRPFYAGGYAPIPKNVAELRQIAAPERYRLEPILRFQQGGRLLEIGPWRGVFCVNAQDAGFAVSAIEMDEQCVRFLRDEVGVDAVQSMDPSATMAAMTDRFDVIALWHSIEHLREPWKVIEQAAARLAPGGILLIALPNIESYEFALLKQRWRHLDAPRHLHFYPAASLAALCARHGLTKVELKTHDRLSKYMAMDTWFQWTKRWLGSHFYTMPLAERLYRLALRRERKRKHLGSGMTAVFRKSENG